MSAPDFPWMQPGYNGIDQVMASMAAMTRRRDSLPTVNAAEQQPDRLQANHAAVARLYWSLESPIEDSVFVVAEGRDMADNSNLEPLFAPHGTHPLAQELISEKPQSSLKVGSVQLSHHFVDDWVEEHLEHTGVADRHLVPMTTDDLDSDDDGSVVGEEYDEEDQPLKLMRCCGTRRPDKIQRVTVTASSSRGVTIHDYVSALHPWLLTNRSLYAASLRHEDSEEQNDKLMVYCSDPLDIMVRRERETGRLVTVSECK